MKILLHVCCADCVLRFIDGIKNKKIDIFFYNPNIHPRAEYLARLEAIKKVINLKEIKLLVPDWSPKEYLKNINQRDGRCIKCWRLRLERTAIEAKRKGYAGFSSTLLSSKYQNREEIRQIGKELENKYEIEWYEPEKINRDLKTSGFYKQFFCGCIYSLEERYKEKYS